MTITQEVLLIQNIIDADYDHECPDVLRTKAFARAYASMLRRMFKRKGYQLFAFKGNWKDASGFIVSGSKHIYISVGYGFRPDGWANDILIRTAKNANDYHGGSNHSTTISNLLKDVTALFEGGEF